MGEQDEDAGVGAGAGEGEKESGPAEGEGLPDEEGLLQSQVEEDGRERAAIFRQQQRRRGQNVQSDGVNYFTDCFLLLLLSFSYSHVTELFLLLYSDSNLISQKGGSTQGGQGFC